MSGERGEASARARRELHGIENGQKRVRLPMRELENFLDRTTAELGLRAGCAFVRLVTDGEMRRLSRRFRGKDKTTDVLSFPSETRTRPKALRARTKQLRKAFLGDIAISPVTAQRNGKAFGRTTVEEICVLMLHGFLHLLGYDHETDRGEMERVESTLRGRLGLS
ncbi:MAG TPA: rRNA maturation RNase YbeY [Candidatus Eremiobacteraceae bacterium]|nr:rRNA maturation RNase YbeY [Candidatus Eremiobacteraceae bacterium]